MKEEVWKPVKDYEGLYEVSNLGRVRSLDRKVRGGVRVYKGKIRRLMRNWDGYLRVALTKDGNAKVFFVHRLVSMAFIPNPEGKSQVNHIDGVKSNNVLENLEWVSASENGLHAYATGLSKISEESKSRRIKAWSKRVRCIDDGNTFDQIKMAAEYYGLSASGICHTLSGKQKTTGGRRFEYIDKKD